jgi:hypothetical protein
MNQCSKAEYSLKKNLKLQIELSESKGRASNCAKRFGNYSRRDCQKPNVASTTQIRSTITGMILDVPSKSVIRSSNRTILTMDRQLPQWQT